MEQYDIYKDIAERTNGDIYIGVVGPVRTGKSTFIKRFMDLLVIPNIENNYTKERAKDELPQSASGKTIMTTEPKFVPNEAVKINIGDNLALKVRMIDCVGYLVPGAEGQLDGDQPRMIMTPWSQTPLPFNQAAEIGTKKVINDHSTIGVVISTDGTITDIPRENYVEAEERVINELKEINKPFVVLLNTTRPFANETEQLKSELTEKYNVPVIPVNCAQLKGDDIAAIIEKVLYEFPVKEIKFNLAKWIETLNTDHWLKKDIVKQIKGIMGEINKLRDIGEKIGIIEESEYIKKIYMDKILPGEGSCTIEISTDPNLFYRILSETTGMNIENDYQLIDTIKKLSEAKKNYDKIEYALNDVERKGYGIVSPIFEDIKLNTPEMFKQGNRYGIKLKAKGKSIHMLKVDLETEISPIVGGEEQSKEFIENLIKEYESEPEKIWNLNIFGRTLSGLINEGMQNKIYSMPEDAQLKLQETLQKIVNEGNGGLICIIL